MAQPAVRVSMIIRDARQNGDGNSGRVAADESASGLRESDARAVDLTLTCLTAELGRQLGNLGQSGGRERMAPRLQPTAGIHGNPAAI